MPDADGGGGSGPPPDGSPPTLGLRRATDVDLAAVERLLDAAGLPTDDVRDGGARFYLAFGGEGRDGGRDGGRPADRDTGEPVAVGGLEPAGDAALLRSVAVAPARRGEGVGSALVRALEERAADEGVATLVLLTTDAAEFFAARGYDRVDRTAIPGPLRSTPQVDSLCPDSATVLRRRL